MYCLMDKELQIGDQYKNNSLRNSLRERVVETAFDAFVSQGIKCVTMDEIANILGISKRTLYEVFADKETLLVDCILKFKKEADTYAKTIYDESTDVLEVLLKCYLYSIEKLHRTNKRFFDDLKKYPKAHEVLRKHQHQDNENAVAFFTKGVEQGLFRNDVNFAIVNLLAHEQVNMLMNSEVFKAYPFLEVYESIMFTYIRGISTEKGIRRLDDFILEYRHLMQTDK